MGIGRLLIVLAVIWLAVRLYRGYRRQSSRGQAAAQGKLVRCAQCGVYLPAADARRNADDAPVCAHHRTGPD